MPVPRRPPGAPRPAACAGTAGPGPRAQGAGRLLPDPRPSGPRGGDGAGGSEPLGAGAHAADRSGRWWTTPAEPSTDRGHGTRGEHATGVLRRGSGPGPARWDAGGRTGRGGRTADAERRWRSPPLPNRAGSARVAGRRWMIKRVVAVPGDPAPALPALPRGADGRVPPGQLVLLGDNSQPASTRASSATSRRIECSARYADTSAEADRVTGPSRSPDAEPELPHGCGYRRHGLRDARRARAA